MAVSDAVSTSSAASSPEGLDLPRLRDHLVDVLEVVPGPLRAGLVAGGRSNPTYEITDGERNWILRRPPLGKVFRSAHDMLREARVVRALAGSSVPVPMVVAACDDLAVLGVPFYVMDRIDGRTFRVHADTAQLTPTERASLSRVVVDTLVRLHNIDVEAVGLADFGRPEGYLARQLTRWSQQWEAIRTKERPEVSQLAERLQASMPALRFPGIVHGDYKLDNIMVARDQPARVVGLLDWEMATYGDTLADLGQLVSFWDEPGKPYNPISAGVTAHPGFATADEIIAAYAEQRRIPVQDIEWYIVFADFKLAVILEQIHARHIAGETVGNWFDDVGAMVPVVLSRALERAAFSRDPRLRH